MAKRSKGGFFKKQEPHSAVKAQIVADYFGAWARIVDKIQGRVLYLDFFCGPGRYEDGSESTPILVLKKIVSNPKLRTKVVTFFGDKDKEAVARL